jgi:hypothetical protein
MTHINSKIIDAMAEAYAEANCPNREGPYGIYYKGEVSLNLGRRQLWYIRDFRDPNSLEYGHSVFSSSNKAEVDAMHKNMTDRHVFTAVLLAAAKAMEE